MVLEVEEDVELLFLIVWYNSLLYIPVQHEKKIMSSKPSEMAILTHFY